VTAPAWRPASIWCSGWTPRSQAASGPRRSNFVEYVPRPPFDAGHMSEASPEARRLANEMMDESIPADQRRLVPKIAWRRLFGQADSAIRRASKAPAPGAFNALDSAARPTIFFAREAHSRSRTWKDLGDRLE
jgi:hypothetical protein